MSQKKQSKKSSQKDMEFDYLLWMLKANFYKLSLKFQNKTEWTYYEKGKTK